MQEKITFKNRQAQVLAGVLHKPEGRKAHACAVFAHCFTCSKNSKAAVSISEALATEGITVLRFDFTGLGQSEVVSIDQAAMIYTQAKHPKSFVTLDNADHLLTHRLDSIYAARMLAAWASRYIGFESHAAASARYLPGASVVHGNTSDGMLVSVNANGHQFIGDEPPEQGGTGLGPTPGSPYTGE